MGELSENPEMRAINSRVYASPRLVSGYIGRELNAGEVAVIAQIEPSLPGRRVLELGCGAGAITKPLLDAGGTVVGVDVSPAMVEYCTNAFPGGRFLVGELRDLSAHLTGSYDVVVAGANVLDVLEHDERAQVFRELRRVLVPDGILYFSSHNRRSELAELRAARQPHLRFHRRPNEQARAFAGFALGFANRRRLGRYERFEPEYAIINDPAHRWGLLHHYITRDAQERDLVAAGFELRAVWSETGVQLAPGDDDRRSSELHYLAQAR